MQRTLAHALLLSTFALPLLACGGDESSATGATTAGSTTAGSTTAGTGATSTTGGQGGGASTSSSSAAGGSGGGAVDPCAGRLICDDFEDDTLGAAPLAPWQTNVNQGAVVVDGAHAHSGMRAVKVSTDAGQYKQALFYAEGAPAFPVPGNVVYGRMMIYMPQTANDGVHWTMIQGSGPVPGHAGVTGHYRYGGMWQGKMMANYETSNAATDCWNNSDTVMPTGAWTCMEWRFDGPANDMRFWLDGTEVADLHVTQQGMGCGGQDLGGDWLAPDFERMYLGWESYQQDDAREAWIDDVIIDDQPIGCPGP